MLLSAVLSTKNGPNPFSINEATAFCLIRFDAQTTAVGGPITGNKVKVVAVADPGFRNGGGDFDKKSS